MENEKKDAYLAEYSSLRSEIYQSMNSAASIMGFGLATIGIIISSAIESTNSYHFFVLLSVGVPLVTTIILSMWFAEHERIARASHYLSGLEKKLSGIFEDPDCFGWEAWLRQKGGKIKNRHLYTPEYSGIAMLSCFSIGSPIFAITSGHCVTCDSKWIVVLTTYFALSVFYWSFRKRLIAWNKNISACRKPTAESE